MPALEFLVWSNKLRSSIVLPSVSTSEEAVWKREVNWCIVDMTLVRSFTQNAEQSEEPSRGVQSAGWA